MREALIRQHIMEQQLFGFYYFKGPQPTFENIIQNSFDNVLNGVRAVNVQENLPKNSNDFLIPAYIKIITDHSVSLDLIADAFAAKKKYILEAKILKNKYAQDLDNAPQGQKKNPWVEHSLVAVIIDNEYYIIGHITSKQRPFSILLDSTSFSKDTSMYIVYYPKELNCIYRVDRDNIINNTLLTDKLRSMTQSNFQTVIDYHDSLSHVFEDIQIIDLL